MPAFPPIRGEEYERSGLQRPPGDVLAVEALRPVDEVDRAVGSGAGLLDGGRHGADVQDAAAIGEDLPVRAGLGAGPLELDADGPESRYDAAMGQLTPLELKYEENVFSFSFSALDFNVPDGTTVTAWLVVSANQFDGGGVNSASYVRLGTFERSDGGVPTLLGGGYSNIGTDREDDTTWTGPSVPSYDGGVVQINVTGAAAQTITWGCFLQLFGRPRLSTSF